MILFYIMSIWILISTLVRPNTLLKNGYFSNASILVFSILLIIFTPFQTALWYGEDMLAYTTHFTYINQLSLFETFSVSIWEPLFVLKQWLISRVTSNTTIYIIISLILYISIFLLFVRKTFLPWQRIFVVYLYFNYTFFYAYIFNGMRQGFAMMFMLLLIALIINNGSKFKKLLALILASLTHYSSIPIVLFILIANKLKIKTLLIVWLFFAIMFITNANQIFGQLPLSFVESYTSEQTLLHYGGETNNINFLIFNTVFLLIGIFLYWKIEFIEGTKEKYSIILKSYIAANVVFMTFGFIAFSNRIASFSWFIIPILLIYPILNQRKPSAVKLFLCILIFAVLGITLTNRYFSM